MARWAQHYKRKKSVFQNISFSLILLEGPHPLPLELDLDPIYMDGNFIATAKATEAIFSTLFAEKVNLLDETDTKYRRMFKRKELLLKISYLGR